MGRVKNANVVERDHIEAAQAALCGLLVSVDECILRNQQAMRRTGVVVEVLEPAVVRMEMLRAELRVVQRELSAAWVEGQQRKWEGFNGQTGEQTLHPGAGDCAGRRCGAAGE